MAVGRVEHLARAQENLRDHPFTLADALLRAHDHAHALHSSLGDQVIAGDLLEAGHALKKVSEHEQDLMAALAEVVQGSRHEPHALKPLITVLTEWRSLRERVGELLVAGRWADASYIQHTEGEQAYRNLHTAMWALLELERSNAAQLRDNAAAAERSAVLAAFVLAVLAGGSLAAMALGGLFFVRTNQPLARLRGCLLRLAGGDTSVSVPYRSHDNAVGAIARAIDGFRRSMIERDTATEALRRSKESLRQAVLEAHTANDSKSRFLAAASHDLRQPLQALRLYLDTLDARLTDRMDRRILAGAIDALAAGEDLLRNYLDVSVLEAGILAPRLDDVALKPLLEELTRQYAAEADAKGLDLRMVPPHATVRSDPALLRRLLSNLIANAIRYTQDGGVLIGCRHQGDAVRIEVWDTGIGIPADKLDSVFEDFYQVGNSERDRTRGLGLGLSVVDRTARLLDHKVTVRSRVGKGSVFSVTLPLTRWETPRLAPRAAA
jgi:signal transduction histidine kinase